MDFADTRKAEEHAEQATALLKGVDSRKDEGAMFGAVKAQSANAHALLALYYAGKGATT